MDYRPVAQQNALRTALTKTLLAPFKNIFQSTVGHTQYGCGQAAGATQLTHTIHAYEDAHPEFAKAALDIKNAFQEVERAAMLKALWEEESLRPLFMFAYHHHHPAGDIFLGGGYNLIEASFKSVNGVQQGDVAASFFFCQSTKSANEATQRDLASCGGKLTAGMDDQCMLGPPELIFPLITKHAARLKKVGLVLRESKCKAYIAPRYRTPAYHELREQAGINEGKEELDDGTKSHGFIYYGIPFGDTSFVANFLDKKVDDLTKEFETLDYHLDPAVLVRSQIPTLQIRWLFVLRCLQNQGTYYTRHLDPRITKSFAARVDQMVFSFVSKTFSRTFKPLASEELPPINTLEDIAAERLRLPIRYRGCGLRELHDRRHAEYIGSLTHALPYMIDMKVKGGRVKGRCQHSKKIVHLLGKGSFDPNSEHPWKVLLSHGPRSKLGSALAYSWQQLELKLNSTGWTPKPGFKSLIKDTKVESAGFHRGAAIKQTTNAIATEVEQARLYRLKAVARDNHVFPSESTFTHQALRCCDEYSSQFLRANPDAVGILTDAQFTEGFHTYLGLPSPCTANFVGQHIASLIVKTAPKPICEYGIAITNAQVPGFGWRQCHDKLEGTIAGMSRFAGLPTEVQPASIWNGRVPGPVLRRYYDRQSSARNEYRNNSNSKHEIIADIAIDEYPIPSDTRVPGTCTALIEIKTLRFSKAHYRISVRACDKRAKEIRQEYCKKAKTCDEIFAPGVEPPPFSTALTSFASSGVMPICCGAFAEFNTKTTNKLIYQLAKMGAQTEEGLRLSPHSDPDDRDDARRQAEQAGGANSESHQHQGKAGPRTVLLRRYRQALGVMAVRFNADLKLNRLRYIKPEAGHATQYAKEVKSKHFRVHNTGPVPHWFQGSQNDAYYAYESFVQGNRFDYDF
jgi:hypothetical protein